MALGKGFTVCSFDTKTSGSWEIWLTDFELDKGQKLLLAVWKKHDNDFLQFVRADKYRYSPEMATATSLLFETFDAGTVDSMPWES